MSEKKDTPAKLQPTAKEFVPKEKKSVNEPGTVTREIRSGSVSLNPAAREFVPKISPTIAPVPAPSLLVPPPLPEEGSLVVPRFCRGKEEDQGRAQTQYFTFNGQTGIEKPEKVYAIQYMMMYKKTCHRKPKDMKTIEIPLKSKSGASTIEKVPEELDNAETLRNLRILLNKLTRDNFARIADTIVHNFVYNKEILEGLVVNLLLDQRKQAMLFNKCVNEPNFIDLYMEIVDQLFIKFKVPKGKPKGLQFKRPFLDYCQKKLKAKENDILLMAPTGEYDEVLMEKKDRIMGSVKLIAKLFVYGAIPDDYVKLCLDKLLKKAMDDNVESAAVLLQGIGQKLYEYFAFEAKLTTLTKKPKLKVKKFTKETFDDYIDKLVSLKQTATLSSKTKFAIQDLVDARDKVWSNAFNQFPVSKEAGKFKEDIVAYRKKSKAPPEEKIVSPVKEPEVVPEPPEKSLAEQNVFGRNLDKLHKSKLEEKIRVSNTANMQQFRINNIVNEYLEAKQFSEVIDVVTELNEVHQVSKAVIAGNFILYAYPKKVEEFRAIIAMLIQLVKEGVLFDKELEEAQLQQAKKIQTFGGDGQFLRCAD
eukprot:TRINITY_DN1538_c0_g1_i1.p3 TRINITY_DN1538_c0_g1~~TRINITY_DN1538_c0_g1_i1.p3  ORF type:complete len:588 (-),score=81.04 TRINITY_DN1538_c0_g1_i1:256-2019(-)